MDVLIRRAADKAIMLFRILGKAFNPTVTREGDDDYNAELLTKLPDSVNYEYSLDMNVIRLMFNIGRTEANSENETTETGS